MINGKKILALIPAKKTSRGLPGKNYKLLCGKPLVEWSIDAALESKYIDWIVVSTNSEKIKKICKKKEKCVVLTRPESLCKDNSPTEDTMSNTILYCSTWNCYPDVIVLLQPTSPFRPNNLVDRCIEKYFEEDADSLMTTTLHTPFFVGKDKEGKLNWLFDPKKRPMRQSIEKDGLYLRHDCGSVYLTDVKALEKCNCRIGEKPVIYDVSFLEGLQIDTECDFKLIELCMKNFLKKDKDEEDIKFSLLDLKEK